MDVKIHAGTVAAPAQQISGANYVVLSLDGQPAAIVVNLHSKLLIVTADDGNFGKILEQYGQAVRKAD